MNWKNTITELLAVEYPIIQAPMLGVTTPAMVAAAGNANCLGTLALGDLPAEKCTELIRSTRLLIKNNFAVNIFVHEIPVLTEELRERYHVTKGFIENLAAEHHLEVHLPAIETIQVNSYHDQIDAIIAEKCRFVSFTFGNLDDQSIYKLKNNGTLLIGTCTSVNEAIILEKSGIDIICVQGLEAGGHRGSFSSDDIPEIGGLSLLPQVYDSVSRPIIYAGGIYNAKTLRATQILGAQGFQLGSLLLGSSESALEEFEKQRLRDANETDILLTNSFSGRYARGVKNTFIRTVGEEHILPYPYQNKLTGELRRAAKEKKNSEFVSIWTGQSPNGYSGKSTTEIMENLIKEVEALA